MRSPADDTRERGPWLAVAAACGALLVVPLVAWLALGGRLGSASPPLLAARPAELPPVEPSASDAPTPFPSRPAPAAEALAAAVTGVVLDPAGAPIAGATVTCTHERCPAVLTDEGGRFELPREASGSQAHATHPLFGSSEVLWLALGGENTLRLTSGGAIAGTVVDEHGAPVAAFVLSVDSYLPAATFEAPAQLGKTLKADDPGGAFLWQGLLAGRYLLTASAAERPPTVSAPVTVELGKTTGGVRIVLPRGARLSGTVVDVDSRSPVEGASVLLDRASWPGASGVAPATTDAAGAYTLLGVPPGPFSVRVAREGYRLKVVAGLVTGGAPEIREDVSLRRFDGGAGLETTGVGVHLGGSPGGVLVIGVLPKGSGARAGVRLGDRLLAIDGVPSESLTSNQCSQRLSCREGAQLRLTLAREGSPSLELTLPCEAIVL